MEVHICEPRKQKINSKMANTFLLSEKEATTHKEYTTKIQFLIAQS